MPCSAISGLDGSKTPGDDGHEGFVGMHTPRPCAARSDTLAKQRHAKQSENMRKQSYDLALAGVLVHAERHVDSPRPLPTLHLSRKKGSPDSERRCVHLFAWHLAH